MTSCIVGKWQGHYKTEWHSAVCECSTKTCKGGLFLIVRMYTDLEQSRISIKETVILVIPQSFQYLINEG